MNDPIDIAVRDSFDALPGLAAQWDALLAESAANTVFLTSGWLRAWQETLGRDRHLLIVTAQSNGRLIGAAAFQEERGEISFAGKGPSDYADIVLSCDLDAAAAQSAIVAMLLAVRAECRRFRCFLLGRIPGDSKTLQCLPRRADGLYAVVGPGTVAPAMHMEAAAEKLRKKSLRRHERVLQRQGNLEDRTHAHAAQIQPLLDPFFEQHIERWSGTPFPSLFLKDTNRDFYRKVVERLDTTAWLRFTALNLDDRMVAAHFGFHHADRFTWYKPSYDIRLEKLSPGEVLLKRLIEQAAVEKAGEFDFTIGAEPFKFRFATLIRTVVNLHITDSWLRSMVKRSRVFVSARLHPENKAAGQHSFPQRDAVMPGEVR